MKRHRIADLAARLTLACVLLLGGGALSAQSHATPPAHTEPSPTHAPAQGTPVADPHAASGQGAHHGPEIKLFGLPLNQVGQFGVRVVNFAIFFAILYVLLKGALSSAFKARAKELEEQLAQAERDKAEGEAQLLELEARMATMQSELQGIMARAEADAEAEKQKVLEAARAEAELILAQTQVEIDFQKRLAEKELRALVAELAVEGASKRLEARVQGRVAEEVLDRAIQQVGGVR